MFHVLMDVPVTEQGLSHSSCFGTPFWPSLVNVFVADVYASKCLPDLMAVRVAEWSVYTQMGFQQHGLCKSL